MTWAALDDKFHGHRKLALLGPLRLPCAGLHAVAISWCADHLTDGVVPRAVAEFLAGNPKQTDSILPGFCQGPAEDPVDLLISELIRVRLWEDNRDGTYTLHNYLRYNRSRRHAMKVRKKRAIAGRLGGLATAKHFAKQVATAPLGPPSPSPSPSPLRSKDVNVSDNNGVAPATKTPAETELLLTDILAVTGDPRSARFYRRVVAGLPAERILALLSETRQAAAAGRITKTPARFFTFLARRALTGAPPG